MFQPKAPLPPDVQTQVGKDLFNYTWTLIELDRRTVAQEDAMVHAAHASRHHWTQVGKPENLARGDWLISHVYAILGRPEPALHHAHRCLQICRENGIADWDIAAAYEALARASAVAGDIAGRDRYIAEGLAACRHIAEDEEREHIVKQFEDIPQVKPAGRTPA